MDLQKEIERRIRERNTSFVEEVLPPPPLWKHQQEAVDRARGKKYFGLLFELGTGKSRTLISIIEELLASIDRPLKGFLFCPSIVVENFYREFQRFGDKTQKFVCRMTGTLKSRELLLRENWNSHRLFITNYESLYNPKLEEAMRMWKPDILVCDEMHRLKDPNAKRTKAVTLLSDIAEFRYGLSGTPILNSHLDIFSQARILDRGQTFGKNFFVFRAMYFYDANASRKGTHGYFPLWSPRPNISSDIGSLIAPFTMRVTKKEALDLPELVRKEYYCEMGADQEKAYQSMKTDFIAFLNDKACVAQLALTKALRLQQIVSGFIKIGDETQSVETTFKDVPRESLLQHVLEDLVPYHKVIVWACFKKNYEMIANICSRLKIKYSMLHGETPDKQHQIDMFQENSEYRVMIANQAAGGIGINLTAASYMIYYSKSFSLEHELQSEARAHRGGSEIHEKITRIDLITRGTIDELITKKLASKKEIGDSVLDPVGLINLLRNNV